MTAGGDHVPVYTTGGEPDRQLLIRCGNRRASVCPPCSREYAGDVWHLLHAGTAGGSKGVPASVAAHPMWFVTLTGPGFGAVHGEGCGRGRAGGSASGGRPGSAQVTCAHDRHRGCPVRHGVDDPEIGEALCPDCYDYAGSVAFNWWAPELWRRFTIAVRRGLAAAIGVPESRLRERLRFSYAKVAEFQRRGVVHFHGILRLDGPGDGYPAVPAAVRAVDVPAVLRDAAASVAITVRSGASSSTVLRFGEQLDVRSIRSADAMNVDAGADDPGQGPVTAGMVAGYIAKYATKAAEDFGLHPTIRSSAAATAVGLRPHVAAIILAGEHLARLDEYAGLARWLHMLGFRGHFTSKSQRFSVTLGALRQARRDHQAAKDRGPDHEKEGSSGRHGAARVAASGDRVASAAVVAFSPLGTDSCEEAVVDAEGEVIEVVGRWRFLGLGYLTAGDALLAARAHADHVDGLTWARESRTA